MALDAADELKEFAEKVDAPVCDTLMGKGAFNGTDERYSGILGNAVMPVYWALQYWSRRSELSADRAGAVALGSIEKVVEVQLQLAGGPREITQNVNVEEFVKQADYYDTLQNNTWDKLLQNYAILGASHPFTAIRVREILKWGKTEQCQRILKNIKLEQDGLICPNCGKPLEKDWIYCKHCGFKLK